MIRRENVYLQIYREQFPARLAFATNKHKIHSLELVAFEQLAVSIYKKVIFTTKMAQLKTLKALSSNPFKFNHDLKKIIEQQCALIKYITSTKSYF